MHKAGILLYHVTDYQQLEPWDDVEGFPIGENTGVPKR